ncbi:permease for cytosine/purines, uracil, thiamine, allantoin-domain-containing protein [Dipodascopsis tothii]|uniref:permease for cytosine/purines, uracil, thiamine, allantoin-domain-containing protein n=1 Tax=Dipodascopsis tothii TaxID=44089 RepID=UPI0034CE08C8
MTVYDLDPEVGEEKVAEKVDSYEISDGSSVDTSLYGRIQNFAGKYAMEARGVERVPEDERTDSSIYKAGSFWFAINLVVSALSIGAVGPELGLAFWDSVLVILFFNALGAAPVALFSLFGPKLGFRQMILGRYWFGMQGNKIFSFLNLISCVGWSAINTIVGAQMLHTIGSSHNVPPWAGVLIITLLAFTLTLFGYKIVHNYEKYCWIPTFIILIIICVRLHKSGAFTTGELKTGQAEIGAVLTFGSILFGGTAGWATFACDYVVYQPKTTNPVKLFFVVFFALWIPIVFVDIIGLACMMGTFTNENMATSYENNGIGGLLHAILVDNSLHGFGEFCLVVLALSTIGGTCPNNYSFGLTIQALDDIFLKVPRIIWAVVSSGLFIAVSIPAYYSFNAYMQDFMNIMGYWVSSYMTIAALEHFYIRKGYSGYDVTHWNDSSKLPPGWATLIAFLAGVGAMVVGMDQTWWTGPLAKKVEGDIAFELCIGFSGVVFMIARPLELKYFGH